MYCQILLTNYKLQEHPSIKFLSNYNYKLKQIDWLYHPIMIQQYINLSSSSAARQLFQDTPSHLLHESVMVTKKIKKLKKRKKMKKKKPTKMFYSKSSSILLKDQVAQRAYPILQKFRMFEAVVCSLKVKPLRNCINVQKKKPFKLPKNMRTFRQYKKEQFLGKLRLIVSVLKNQSLEQMNWLTNIIQSPLKQAQEIMKKESDEVKVKMYNRFIEIVSRKCILDQDIVLKKWVQDYLQSLSYQIAKKNTVQILESQSIQQNTNNNQEIVNTAVQRSRSDTNQNIDPNIEIEIISKSDLKVGKPRCGRAPECKKYLSDFKCSKQNHLIAKCQQCGWNDHICIETSEQIDFPNLLEVTNIQPQGDRLAIFYLPRLHRRPHKNNIRETVEKSGYIFTKQLKALQGLPKVILSYIPLLPKVACSQIILNREEQEYLPLEIKQSLVEHAGLGLFATSDIVQKGTLICSYLGEIGLGSRTPVERQYGDKRQNNNSIFTIGWIDKKQILIICPNKYSNVGRFANYNSPEKCNAKASLCLIERLNKRYEIVVFLSTTRKIKAGEEIFYDYGPQY